MKTLLSLVLALLLHQFSNAQPEDIDSTTWGAMPEVYRLMLSKQAPMDVLHTPPTDRLYSESLSDSVAARTTDYFSQNVPGAGAVVDVQVSPGGDVFVTGYRSKYPYGNESVIIRYDASGTELWTTVLSEFSVPTALTLDKDGGIYVAGTGWSTDAKEIVIVKCTPDGLKQWIRRYSGMGRRAEATALVAHDAGGVVVGGTVPGRYGFDDAAVVLRYSSQGEAVWQREYDDDRYANDDRPLRLMSVPDGGVIVVNNDGTVLKLAAGGGLEWVEHETRSMSTNAFAAAVDEEGSVYVFGRDAVEIETRKLSSSGTELWRQGLEASAFFGDILLDETGLVVSTLGFGPKLGGIGVATILIRYTREGEERWRYLEDDPAYGPVGVAVALTRHTDSTFYAVGDATFNQGPIVVISRFDSTGSLKWSRPYDGNGGGAGPAEAVAATPTGGVVMGMGGGASIVSVAFDESAAPLWTARSEGAPRSRDAIVDMSIGPDGNVYLAGRTWTANGGDDLLVASTAPTGEVRWVERFDGGSLYSEYAVALDVDEESNVFVTGVSPGAGDDIVALSFDSSGMLRWSTRYDGGFTDTPVDIVADGEGRAYVAGSSLQSNRPGILTIRLDHEGTVLWDAFTADESATRTYAAAMALLPTGGVVVTGTRETGMERRYFTLNYAPDGAERWQAIYENRAGEAADVTVDGAGRIYVAGSTSTNNEMTTVAYEPDGSQRWDATHATGYLFTFGRRIASGPHGVHTTGTRTLAYDFAGGSRWMQDRPALSIASDIAIDSRGRTYNVGLNVDDVRQRVGIEVLDRSGERIFSRWQPQREPAGIDAPGAFPLSSLGPYSDPVMALSASGDVYVVNNVAPLSSMGAFTVTRYTREQIPLDRERADAPAAMLHLFAPYPNPFEGDVTITFATAQASEATLEIFDLLGRRVGRLAEGLVPAGHHSVRWNGDGLAGGIYIVRLSSRGTLLTRRMVLIR